MDTSYADLARLSLLVQRILDADALCDTEGASLLTETEAARHHLEECDVEAARRHVEQIACCTEALIRAEVLDRADGRAVIETAWRFLAAETGTQDNQSRGRNRTTSWRETNMASNSFGIVNSANNGPAHHLFGEKTKAEFAKTQTMNLRSFGLDSDASKAERTASIMNSGATIDAAECSLHLLENMDGDGI